MNTIISEILIQTETLNQIHVGLLVSYDTQSRKSGYRFLTPHSRDPARAQPPLYLLSCGSYQQVTYLTALRTADKDRNRNHSMI